MLHNEHFEEALKNKIAVIHLPGVTNTKAFSALDGMLKSTVPYIHSLDDDL